MQLHFEKWHGCKNNFVLIWLSAKDQLTLNSIQSRAAEICSKGGDGIGADGIVVLQTATPPSPIPENIKIINQDGSLASTCGNAIRCAALSTLEKFRERARGGDTLEGVEFKLDGHAVFCQFLFKFKGHDSALPWVSVQMGTPLVNEDTSWYKAAQTNITSALEKSGIKGLERSWAVCELLNRHIVFYLSAEPKFNWHDLAKALQTAKDWDGINVHFAYASEPSPEAQKANSAAKVLQANVEDSYTALVWERGVGPTQACGSGACAIVAGAMALEDLPRQNWVEVQMPGGQLYVQQKEADEPILLAGPAVKVFTGVLDF